MPNTIGSVPAVTDRCAVIKIDLRGRFVFIDDAAEKIIGASSDDLIGRSIFEFVTNGSVQDLESLLSRSSRYESFYIPLSLTIRTVDSETILVSTIITQNFIGGNPANYQIILIPSNAGETRDTESIEKKFLRLLDLEFSAVDFNMLSEIFGRAGGYSAAECYQQNIDGRLLAIGGWPRRNLDYTPPVYIEAFYRERQLTDFSRAGFDPLLINVDGRHGEGGILMRGEGDRPVFVHLHGPSGYSPSEAIQGELRLLAGCWNRRFTPTEVSATIADRLSLLGRLTDTVKVGMAVIDDRYEFIYKNETVNNASVSAQQESVDHFAAFFNDLHLICDNGERATFESSPFAQVFGSDKILTARYADFKEHDTLTIVAAPFHLGDTPTAAFMFVPDDSLDQTGRFLTENAAKTLHNLSLDLKPPLLVVEGMVRYLLEHHGDRFEGNCRTAIDSLRSNCRLLYETMIGLEDLNSHFTLINVPEPVDTEELISGIVKNLSRNNPKADFEIEIDPALPEITVPRQKITGVFTCLLDNAFKYGAEADRPSIMIVYDKKHDQHHFAVSDSGPGIPESYAQEVFEPFFRIPREAVKDIPGAGVGLNIAATLAGSMGGAIKLESTRRGGATFTLVLPAGEDA